MIDKMKSRTLPVNHIDCRSATFRDPTELSTRSCAWQSYHATTNWVGFNEAVLGLTTLMSVEIMK